MTGIDLTIVVPCYNEAPVLPETSRRLLGLLDRLNAGCKASNESCVFFVDDGSHDRTWATIEDLAVGDRRVRGMKLSRNRGQQNALLAGMTTVQGDAVITINADLQDDIAVIEDMVDAHRDGKDIVYGVRAKRESDTRFKRFTAGAYYRLLKWMGVDIVANHADYRLMSRRALETLKEYSEVNLFLRGIVPTIGLPSAVVTYARSERGDGESKYPLRKMIGLAIDGITSFTAFPLRAVAGLGIIVFFMSLVLSAWVLWSRVVSGTAIPGWASSVLPVYLLGGIQLLSIGVVGEYAAKIYTETKRRPRFTIEKVI